MLKTLLKKQLLELNRGFFVDQKTGKARTKASSIIFILLYVALMIGVIGGIFYMNSIRLCAPLVQSGLGWLYFAMISIIAIALGIFGSVFNTYASLYKSKDNDILLSLPIPTRYILIARLSGVYLMGLFFSAVVIIPGIIVYLQNVGFGIVILADVVLVLVLSIIVMILSCILGWVVAKISNKLKNKSIITVIVSLAFLVAYYYLYFRANEALKMLLKNADSIGKNVKGNAYPLYLLGRIGEGDGIAVLIVSVVLVVILAVVYVVLERSFLKIATSSGNTVKAVYKEKRVKVKSIPSAMLSKELGRFCASPVYMLNCALGTILLPIAGILVLVKGHMLHTMMDKIFGSGSGKIIILVCFAICIIAAMNNITTPSVSLEGKNIWIAQSLPVAPWEVLKSKIKVHVLVTGIPALFCSVCAAAVFSKTIWDGLFILLIPEIFIIMSAYFGLFLNLKMPNLKWTNETAAVKQNLVIIIEMFGVWVYCVVMGIVCMYLNGVIGKTGAILVLTIISLLIAMLLRGWIRKQGTRIFENL